VSERPDRATLLGFAAVVLIAGSNFSAVKFSNKELAPLFGASIRFALAGFLLLGYVAVRRIALPKGRALVGSLLYGLTGFFVAYALLYIALVKLPAGIGGVIMASVPLLTFFLAYLHRLEPFRLRGLIGAIITIMGIAVLVQAPVGTHFPLISLLAMVGAAIGAAESGIVIKKNPPSNPVATNAVAMLLGAVLLLASSALARESWKLPSHTDTRIALLYLVLVGSIGLFGFYLFVLERWTASGASFQFVLIPLAAVGFGAWIAHEPLTWPMLAGALIVAIGVYVGVLSKPRREAGTQSQPSVDAVSRS
jgi:drug/metabolite transporter (DMT)-like permease